MSKSSRICTRHRCHRVRDCLGSRNTEQSHPRDGTWFMAYLEWVTAGICLAFGRKKSIPATFQCSLGQLINGAAVTASVRESSTSLPPWPPRISTQVKRDYAETDESSGGRKPDTDIHKDALKGSRRNPYRACQNQPPGQRHFLQGTILSPSAWDRRVCLAIDKMQNIHQVSLSKISLFFRKGLFDPHS